MEKIKILNWGNIIKWIFHLDKTEWHYLNWHGVFPRESNYVQLVRLKNKDVLINLPVKLNLK
jgi:hypothetical protein